MIAGELFLAKQEEKDGNHWEREARADEPKRPVVPDLSNCLRNNRYISNSLISYMYDIITP